jgi:hypothetical protein
LDAGHGGAGQRAGDGSRGGSLLNERWSQIASAGFTHIAAGSQPLNISSIQPDNDAPFEYGYGCGYSAFSSYRLLHRLSYPHIGRPGQPMGNHGGLKRYYRLAGSQRRLHWFPDFKEI